eukprot:m.34798 g.34798  ORF g.34798 m.34798 type:complete len:488 (+) comp32023_c0_seq1:879-2342(+)
MAYTEREPLAGGPNHQGHLQKPQPYRPGPPFVANGFHPSLLGLDGIRFPQLNGDMPWRFAAAAAAAASRFYPPSLYEAAGGGGYPEQMAAPVIADRYSRLPAQFSPFPYSADIGVPGHPLLPGISAAEKPSLKRARESTQPLRDWLCKHKDNPYPSKAEKIMLAVVTKLTLTQVSMWFANARRRIKKLGMKVWSKGVCDDNDMPFLHNNRGEATAATASTTRSTAGERTSSGRRNVDDGEVASDTDEITDEADGDIADGADGSSRSHNGDEESDEDDREQRNQMAATASRIENKTRQDSPQAAASSPQRPEPEPRENGRTHPGNRDQKRIPKFSTASLPSPTMMDSSRVVTWPPHHSYPFGASHLFPRRNPNHYGVWDPSWLYTSPYVATLASVMPTHGLLPGVGSLSARSGAEGLPGGSPQESRWSGRSRAKSLSESSPRKRSATPSNDGFESSSKTPRQTSVDEDDQQTLDAALVLSTMGKVKAP